MTPDMTSYHWIVINSSAGKDSQAMLDFVVEQCDVAGVPRTRLVVAHADLGRVEWPGTRELAEEQARHYGLAFHAVKRPQGDLLDHIEKRGMFPSPAARFCTSDHKRAQVHKLLTRLTAESLRCHNPPVRILNCMGLRAQESPARAKKVPFARDERASNRRRVVDAWLPIHSWTSGQVWERIRASGVRHHPAYDLGMQHCCLPASTTQSFWASMSPSSDAPAMRSGLMFRWRRSKKLLLAARSPAPYRTGECDSHSTAAAARRQTTIRHNHP